MRPTDSPDRDFQRLIDRLADGELHDDDRRALLARLDAEASGDGWRRLALAFLEVQCWREAVRPAVPQPAVLPVAVRKPRRPRALVGVAAGLAAFALGWLLRGEPTPTPRGETKPIVVTTAPQPEPAVSARPEPATPQHPPTEPVRPTATASTSAPDRETWQPPGYRVERRNRVVSVSFGGRRVELPVNEVRLRYVGDRTY